jgi:hypothetical protein
LFFFVKERTKEEKLMSSTEKPNQKLRLEKMEALREAMQRKGKVNLLEEKLATILLENFSLDSSLPPSKKVRP